MSIHSSLRSAGQAAGSRRNVLKRHERIRTLMTKGQWAEARSVFGLPKLKQVRVKVRKAETKDKDKAEAGATPVEGATPAGGSAPKGGAAPQGKSA